MNETHYFLLLAITLFITLCSPAHATTKSELSRYQPNRINASAHLLTQLHLSSKPGKRPLLLTLAGSSGGFAYEQEPERIKELTSQGFHVLTAAYMVPKPTQPSPVPTTLSRIRLESFGEEIDKYLASDLIAELVDKDLVGILGTSKGAELALLLASLDARFTFVVAVVPSNVVFQAPNITLTRHSPWILDGKELDYVPYPHVSIASIFALLTNLVSHENEVNFSWMHNVALANSSAVAKATIRVENINGPILLISGFRDQWWPCTKMSLLIMDRLRNHQFPYLAASRHIMYDSDHYPLKNQPARFQAMIEQMQNMIEARKSQHRS